MDESEIVIRYQQAQDIANQFRGIYQRAYALYAPSNNIYAGGIGNLKTKKTYDSTMTLGLQSFANTCMNTITPIHTRWADLEVGDGVVGNYFKLIGNPNPDKQEIDNVRKNYNDDLHAITNAMFSFLNSSNLYSALGSMYVDLGIGTGFLLAMPGDTRFGSGSPLNFRSIHPYYMAIEEGAYGEISGIYRKVSEKFRNVKQEWRDLKGLNVKDDNSKVELFEATLYNDKEGDWDYYLLYANRIVVQRKYRSNPWITIRWSVNSNEVWGRGPALMSLLDSEQLNAAKYLTMKHSQLCVHGAYMGISDDILNDSVLNILPGSIIPVKRNAGPSGPTLAPLPTIGNFNAQLIQSQELESKIKRFLLDDNLPDVNHPKMTATEVLERVRKIQRDFGSVFGRITNELCQPILQRTFDILVYDKGLIPLPKRLSLVYNKIDGFSIKMKMVSPIARVQSMQDVESMMQVIQILGTISPELMASTVKLDDIGEWLADKLGAPAKFIRNDEEKQQYIQSKQEEAQANMIAQQQTANIEQQLQEQL